MQVGSRFEAERAGWLARHVDIVTRIYLVLLPCHEMEQGVASVLLHTLSQVQSRSVVEAPGNIEVNALVEGLGLM